MNKNYMNLGQCNNRHVIKHVTLELTMFVPELIEALWRPNQQTLMLSWKNSALNLKTRNLTHFVQNNKVCFWSILELHWKKESSYFCLTLLKIMLSSFRMLHKLSIGIIIKLLYLQWLFITKKGNELKHFTMAIISDSVEIHFQAAAHEKGSGDGIGGNFKTLWQKLACSAQYRTQS